MFWKRKEHLKDEHPASYPDLPFTVEDSRPMHYHGNGVVLYPPQGGSAPGGGQSNEALLRLMELVGRGVLEQGISMEEGYQILNDYVNGPPRPRVDPRLIGKDER